MNWLTVRLVDDWRDAGKWWSIHCAATNAILQVIFIALLKGVTIAVGALGFVPLAWIPVIGLIMALLSLGARVLKQKKPGDLGPYDYGC